MTEQKSQNDILPSLLLSAFSSISFKVSSSRFSFTCRLISRISLMSMQFLLARSYFLKIAAIYFLFSFKYGLEPIAFMNSLKLMPPAYSISNSAIIQYTVFLLGEKPFWVSSKVRSLGRRTPIPVESYVSNTYLRSITSSIFSCPVTQICGSKCYKSFLLKRTLNISLDRWVFPSLLSGLQPTLSNLFFCGVFGPANDLVLGLFLSVLIQLRTYNKSILEVIKFNTLRWRSTFIIKQSIPMIRDYDYLFKVVLVGNSSVGKSSILRRFADDSFQESYLATIGVDFRFKSITIGAGDIVKLQIWDTAGQERFRTITGAYYKGAHAIVIVYDLTKEESYKDISEFWLGQATKIQKFAMPNVQLFVLGNKLDSPEELRKVHSQQAEQFCQSRGIVFREVSARSGDHISEAFQNVGESLAKIYPKQQRKNQRNPVIEEISKKKKEFQLQSAAQNTKNKSCC